MEFGNGHAYYEKGGFESTLFFFYFILKLSWDCVFRNEEETFKIHRGKTVGQIEMANAKDLSLTQRK